MRVRLNNPSEIGDQITRWLELPAERPRLALGSSEAAPEDDAVQEGTQDS